MLNIDISRMQGSMLWISAIIILWSAIFELDFVEYPRYQKGACFSPNHAFYVTRHQTPWQALMTGFQDDFGTVRVFDKLGNLLHKKEFFVDAQSGSRWLDLSGGDPPKPSKVFYIGGDGSGWEYLLPGSPGSGSSNRDCY